MSAPTLGVLVVGGAGGIGRGSHLPAISSLPQVRLVAVADVDERALDAVRREHGCATYTDLDEALAGDDVDIVDICSPDFAHAEQAMAAARLGKHVLCEEPLALSLEDALAMRQAFREAGVKAMVAQVMRFQPRWCSLREAVAEGRIGRPVFARYVLRGAFYSYPPGSFYRKPESLGQIVHNGMHYFDTVSWLVGARPVWVSAEGLEHYPGDDRLPGPNYWTVQVGFENGALGHLEANLAIVQPRDFRPKIGCFVVGTQGTLASEGSEEALLERWDGAYSWPGSRPPAGSAEGFAAEIAHFAQAVAEDTEPEVSIDWSVRVLEACLACLQSAREARRVELTAPGPD